MEKEIREYTYLFYSTIEDAMDDINCAAALVEFEGMSPPHTLYRTLIKDVTDLKPFNGRKALVNPNNIESCIFKLRKINARDVYVLETKLIS